MADREENHGFLAEAPLRGAGRSDRPGSGSVPFGKVQMECLISISYRQVMKKIWVNKAESFAAAERFDKDYYQSMSAEERWAVVQFLRETYFQSTGIVLGENGKRLRRVLGAVERI